MSETIFQYVEGHTNELSAVLKECMDKVILVSNDKITFFRESDIPFCRIRMYHSLYGYDLKCLCDIISSNDFLLKPINEPRVLELIINLDGWDV